MQNTLPAFFGGIMPQETCYDDIDNISADYGSELIGKYSYCQFIEFLIEVKTKFYDSAMPIWTACKKNLKSSLRSNCSRLLP